MILRGTSCQFKLIILEKWSALNLRDCFVKNSAFSSSTEEKQKKIH
jgi:hypothetical protein